MSHEVNQTRDENTSKDSGFMMTLGSWMILKRIWVSRMGITCTPHGYHMKSIRLGMRRLAETQGFVMTLGIWIILKRIWVSRMGITCTPHGYHMKSIRLGMRRLAETQGFVMTLGIWIILKRIRVSRNLWVSHTHHMSVK